MSNKESSNGRGYAPTLIVIDPLYSVRGCYGNNCDFKCPEEYMDFIRKMRIGAMKKKVVFKLL